MGRDCRGKREGFLKTSLRRHYPEQVPRVGDAPAPPSQPSAARTADGPVGSPTTEGIVPGRAAVKARFRAVPRRGPGQGSTPGGAHQLSERHVAGSGEVNHDAGRIDERGDERREGRVENQRAVPHHTERLFSQGDVSPAQVSKDLPQPQLCLALGLIILNPPPVSASEKSMTVPRR